ncbi:MAG: thiamine pyrophosphate-binding protein, partial [Kiloniellales bacterium]
MTAAPTVAEALVGALGARGVKRIFGVPGGGSSLDIIAATEAHGIDFVLTQTETAAVLMAAVGAELSGVPGVAITGVGPGAASAVNGVAYAALERAPLLLVSDCADEEAAVPPHQVFDQRALFAPLTKATCRLGAEDAGQVIEDMLETAMAPPPGPVHIDLSARQAATPITGPTPTLATPARASPEALPRREASPRREAPPPPPPPDPPEADVAAARALLSRSRRPVIVAGLEAREAAAAAALGRLLDGLDCPLMTTYKAKGAVSDRDRRVVGAFTGAKAEADCVGRADLILFYGVDPVELIPQPWRYRAPLIALSTVAGLPHPTTPAAALTGPLEASADRLRGA